MQCSLKLLNLRFVSLGSGVKAKLSSSPTREIICEGLCLVQRIVHCSFSWFDIKMQFVIIKCAICS